MRQAEPAVYLTPSQPHNCTIAHTYLCPYARLYGYAFVSLPHTSVPRLVYRSSLT
jgi:hypothetical protein